MPQTKALHKVLYNHTTAIADKAHNDARKAAEDLTYLENNEDHLYFKISVSAIGYDMDTHIETTDMGLDEAFREINRMWRDHPNEGYYKGKWSICGRIKTIRVYAKLVHSVVDIPPSIWQRRVPEEMKEWVKHTLEREKRRREERR